MCTGLSVFLITSFLYFIKPPPHAFQCYPLLLPPDKACIVSVMLVNMESVSVCLTFSNSLVLIRLRSSSVCPNLPNPRVCVYVKYTYNVNPVRPRWTRASRESVYVFLSIWPWSPAGRKKKPSNSLAFFVSLGKVRDSYRKESALLLQLTQRWRKSNLNVCAWPA